MGGRVVLLKDYSIIRPMEKITEEPAVVQSIDISGEQLESNEEKEFSEMISSYLNADSFVEKVGQIEYESQRSVFIGEVVEYLVLHRDAEGADAYVDGLLKRKETKLEKCDLLIESVKNKLGIEVSDNDLSDEEAEKIYQYIYERMLRDGYVFHGFNGALETSVRENGLDQSKAPWDTAELDEIGEIGKEYGVNLVGQHYAHIGQERFTSSGKNYYDETSQFFYSYAANSPEWFSQLCNVGKNRGTYHKRHYEEAKANIEECIERMKAISSRGHPRLFTAEDEQKILGFFETYWQRFTGEGAGLKLALVRRGAITKTGLYDNKYETDLASESWSVVKNAQPSEYDDLDKRPQNIRLISYLIHSIGHGGNQHVTYTIPPEYITMVDLPAAEKVYN